MSLTIELVYHIPYFNFAFFEEQINVFEMLTCISTIWNIITSLSDNLIKIINTIESAFVHMKFISGKDSQKFS